MPLSKFSLRLVFLLSFICISLLSSADIRRLCKVQYKTKDGWSDEYTMEVQFITGKELNDKTKSYKYSQYANYCLLWFDKGQVAVLKMSGYITGIGDEFDHEDFISVFSYRSQITCEQEIENSLDTREWEIKAKSYGRFIDPRENN